MASFAAGRIQASTSYGVRGYATLKDISIRLKSVKNIQKITKSMKMVSAAKYARSERELKPARSYGEGNRKFFDIAEVKDPLPEGGESGNKNLYIAVTSDRGLCGGVHSSIAKAIKALIDNASENITHKIVLIGDKSKALLQRTHNQHILMSFNDIGRRPPTFAEACVIASNVIESDYAFDSGKVFYNEFKTVVTYKTTNAPIFSPSAIASSSKIDLYDSRTDEITKCYQEFAVANTIFYAIKESNCSEQSSRMSAMGSATKNAGEMIEKLTLTFNRTRQAVITRELIEIISGAAAV